MSYKGVYTKLKEEEYKKIKEKGYNIAELIRLGLEAKEIQESFVRFTFQVAEKLENTAKIQLQLAETQRRLIQELQSNIASLNSIATRLDLITASINETVNRFDKLLQRQEELYSNLIERFDKLFDKLEQILEDSIFYLEKRLEEQSERLNLSLSVISSLLPKDKSNEVVDAIMKLDKKKIEKLLSK